MERRWCGEGKGDGSTGGGVDTVEDDVEVRDGEVREEECEAFRSEGGSGAAKVSVLVVELVFGKGEGKEGAR